MSVFTPTAEQKAAIDYDDSMVVTACPGSGKTAVIKEKIRKITPSLSKHKGVIAITFTKKASEELRSRCKSDGHDTKQSYFGTIDSFCLNELILPFISRVWEGNPLERKIVRRLKKPYLLFLHEEYRAPSLNNVLNDDGFKRLYDEGILWMRSFAALALHVLNTSASAQRYIKAKYSHVFIDEYQDSSSAQHQLFLKISELGLTATAVGDTWQSIYEFRGGNPEFLEYLVSNTSKFKHFEININHRCHPSIINYASRLLDSDCQLISCEEQQVFRRTLTGNLTDAGKQVSVWISEWLNSNEWGVNKASDIAVFARQDKSLRLIAAGLDEKYRIYSDTPLDEIGSDCAELYSNLLAFKYGVIATIQEIIDTHFYLVVFNGNNLSLIKKAIKEVRKIGQADKLIEKFHELASILSIDVSEASDVAVYTILQDKELIQQFSPLDNNEIQVMTLHKSKGLEFKVVFHFDLEEWSFPFQRVENKDWDNPIYPSLSQDVNLHYVGITRAENCCILIRASQRQNKKGEFKASKPSYFFQLPQLEGLFDMD